MPSGENGSPGTGGGQSISPEGPVQGDALSQRRWVPGYKPRTPEQKQAYDQWLQASRRSQPQAGRSPASNLLEHAVGNNPVFVDKDEEITHTVHHPAVDSAVIDLRTAQSMPETPKQKGPANDIHRSGLTNSEYNLLKELAASGPETEGAQIAEVNSSRAPNTNENLDGIFNTAGGVPPDPVIAVSSNFLHGGGQFPLPRLGYYGQPSESRRFQKSPSTRCSAVCRSVPVPLIPTSPFDEVNDRWVMMTETIQGNGNSYHLYCRFPISGPVVDLEHLLVPF